MPHRHEDDQGETHSPPDDRSAEDEVEAPPQVEGGTEDYGRYVPL